MSKKSATTHHTPSRRTFLKTTAAFSFIGAFGLKTPKVNAQVSAALHDPYYPEPPPKLNAGPVFLRKTLSTPRPTGRFPVLQGATSQTETQFRILIKTNQIYRYWIIDGLGGGRREVTARARAGAASSPSAIDHVYVDGLEADTAYWLEIEATGAKQTTERRQFSTMSAKNSLGDPLRVALISCMNDRYASDQGEMWAAVAKSSPEIMIFNGDCCYVDQRWDGTTEGMWTRHVETRQMLDVFKWDRLIPILTTWDDHDAGANDANSRSPYIKLAREYFDSMFKSDPVIGYTPSAGLDYTFDTCGMRFIFLDNRSNKLPEQVFSPAQEQWMSDQISTSPGPIWLVNGTQFWGAYLVGAESVEFDARRQLLRIADMGRKATSPIVFCSGDIHFSELMEVEKALMGYRTFELCSSAIHSRTFPGQQFRSYNSRRLEATSRYNFMAIEMRAKSPSAVEFETVCLGAANSEFFRFKATVQR